MLNTTGGSRSAGIGGHYQSATAREYRAGNITITGGGVIKAAGNANAAGIGGGQYAVGGTIHASTSTTRNGSANGNQTLYAVAAVVKTSAGVLVPGATVRVGNNPTSNYTYEAETNEVGIAYLWLPARSDVVFEATYPDGSSGSKTATITAAHTNVNATTGEGTTNTVEIKPTYSTVLTATPSGTKQFKTTTNPTPVNLHVNAKNAMENGTILGADWFRVPTNNATVYTDANFATGYAAADPAHRGTSADNLPELPGGTDEERNFAMEVGENGKYWVRVEYTDDVGDTVYCVESIVIDNLYIPVHPGVRGKVEGTSNYLYGSATAYDALAGQYGIPFEMDGTTVVPSPSLGYDQFTLAARSNLLALWDAKLKNNDSPPQTVILDGTFLNNPYADDVGTGEKYTLTYAPKPGSWEEVDVVFVEEGTDGSAPFTVSGMTGDTISVPVDPSDKGMGELDISFTDVVRGAWYYDAIMALATKGVLTGYTDGTFRPEGKITRAEFAAIVSRFNTLMSGTLPFGDVEAGHWAHDYIANTYARGWVNGYLDGTFQPGRSITRAEAIKVTNASLGRVPDRAYIDAHDFLNSFVDLEASYWAYYEIIEATMIHGRTPQSGES